ncbi:hypothetical protein BC936DRAFT_142735 [Jimgerdemannia flammicorona]|uniref:Uncharacterized protein n=1 Tax=Jimgerdemannia flammicorona TaxID=994334 RepID=A0A433DEU5_9FUNG|nr:hypothetical protein BC936DRAFT_142735 [Jimgerdemannia flammicorona]
MEVWDIRNLVYVWTSLAVKNLAAAVVLDEEDVCTRGAEEHDVAREYVTNTKIVAEPPPPSP